MEHKENKIELKTFGDLIKYGYRIDLFCNRCRKGRALDLSKMSPERGYVAARFKCSDCGSRDVGASLTNSRAYSVK